MLKLKAADALIILFYFVGMIAIGWWFSRKEHTTKGYFLGENNTPSWVLGLSMIAAKISSVTFLALPAAAYILDWRMFVTNLTVIPIALLSIWILVPFFRRGSYTTAFEYLNARFGTEARLYGVVIFLLGQALRLGSVIYLVTIPIQMFTGGSPVWIMLMIGGFCALYTILGGIQAVIWTDAIQAIILYLGGIAALIVMIVGVPGGLPEIFRVAMENDKLSLGPMHWDMNDRTFWTMLFTGTFGWIGQYTSDQVLIQRYLAAKDLPQARRAGWISAFLCFPTWAFFFFIGTALWVFYQVNPDSDVAALPADNVFPYFILTRMPTGLVGLVVAGIFSAAMGSLSAALNAFSTVATIDIVKPYLLRDRDDKVYARIAKLLTGVAAIIMLVLGLIFNFLTKESFVDLSQRILGLLGGVLPCFFLLGLFAPRVNREALWKSFPLIFLLNVYLVAVEFKIIPNFLGISVHPYWVATLMTALMLVLALLLSWVQKANSVGFQGLTVFSKENENAIE